MDAVIETLTAAEAAEKLRALGMRISPEMIRLGIRQKEFPFGNCIVTDNGPRCYVYARLLDEWIALRSEPLEQEQQTA